MIDTEEGHLMIENFVNIFFIFCNIFIGIVAQSSKLLYIYIYIYRYIYKGVDVVEWPRALDIRLKNLILTLFGLIFRRIYVLYICLSLSISNSFLCIYIIFYIRILSEPNSLARYRCIAPGLHICSPSTVNAGTWPYGVSVKEQITLYLSTDHETLNISLQSNCHL